MTVIAGGDVGCGVRGDTQERIVGGQVPVRRKLVEHNSKTILTHLFVNRQRHLGPGWPLCTDRQVHSIAQVS